MAGPYRPRDNLSVDGPFEELLLVAVVKGFVPLDCVEGICAVDRFCGLVPLHWVDRLFRVDRVDRFRSKRSFDVVVEIAPLGDVSRGATGCDASSWLTRDGPRATIVPAGVTSVLPWI
jgi:hypothetical protein